MPFDGSGNFVRSFPPGGWVGDASASVKIKSDRHDQHDNDLASGLSNALCKDGQSSPTADINWNGKKITNLGAAVSPTDAVTLGQIQTIRSFATGIALPGAGINNRLEYTAADMSFFVRSTGDPDATITPAPKFVWNDKADGTGTDIATLNEGGALTVTNHVISKSETLVLAATGKAPTVGPPATLQTGDIYLRPQGVADTDGQVQIAQDGAITASGAFTTSSIITGQYLQASGGIIGGASGGITFRPQGYGNAAGQMSLDNGGNVSAAGQVAAGTNLVAGGAVYAKGNTMYMGAGGSGSIVQFGSGHYIDFNTGTGYFYFIINSAQRVQIDPNGGITIQSGVAVKTGGGTWQAPSDARLKTVHGEYEHGLAEVLQVNPKRYAYNATPDVEWVGIVAQEIETVLPETVVQYAGEIDGAPVSDLRLFDPSALTFALINAVKELSAKLDAATARIEALEAP